MMAIEDNELNLCDLRYLKLSSNAFKMTIYNLELYIYSNQLDD